LEDESKSWKFSLSDIEERKHWDNYMKAYSEILNTSTDYAPWRVIPADHKWLMRYAVGQIIFDNMRSLDIRY
jgi:polyphosphate kinase 2 (PPK2 family)